MNKKIIESSIPQYIKIYDQLRQEIKNYTLKPGSSMDSETKLMNRFNVSRQTVRHAVSLLENEGLIEKKQGRKTVIVPLNEKEGKITLHIGTLNPKGILLTDYTCFFAEKVHELTNGQIKIEVHHSSEFGNGSDHIKKISDGSLDMFCAAIDWLADVDKIWALANFPFLYTDIDHLKKFVSSSFNTELKNKLEQQYHIKILADNFYRPSRLLLSKFPCLNAQQIKNMKIGIPLLPLYEKVWKAIGAIPVPVNFSERKQAFINNEIQITDVNWDIILSEGLQFEAKYAITSNHLFSRAAIICNNKNFSKLRKDVQDTIIKAAELTGLEYSKKIFSNYNKHKNILLSQGVTFIEFNCLVWQNIAHSILLSAFSKNSDEIMLYNQIKLLTNLK